MNNRNLPLDLIRGICAIGVAAYHYMLWSANYQIQSLGTFGVYTFFVISALVMMMGYQRTFENALTYSTLKEFFRNRAARIIPLLALVTLFAATKMGGDFSVGRVFLTATGMMALHLPGFLSVTTGAWSLGVELMFYALFPVVCIMAANTSVRGLASIVVFLIFSQQMLMSTLPAYGSPSFWGLYSMPLTFAPFFAMGILAHRVELQPSGKNLALALALLLTIFLSSALSGWSAFAAGPYYIALTVATGGAVLLAYRSTVPAQLTKLSWFVGEISYSLYLTHWYAYSLSGKIPMQELRPLWFTLIALALATALTFVFERPVRDFLRGDRGVRQLKQQ